MPTWNYWDAWSRPDRSSVGLDLPRRHGLGEPSAFAQRTGGLDFSGGLPDRASAALGRIEPSSRALRAASGDA